MRSRLLPLAVCLLLASTALAGDTSPVDPALVGLWMRDMPNTEGGRSILLLSISDDGAYAASSAKADPGDPPLQSGSLTAAAGKYHMTTSAEPDEGRYELVNPNEFHFVNGTGASVYRRALPIVTDPPDQPLRLPIGKSPAELAHNRAVQAEKLHPGINDFVEGMILLSDGKYAAAQASLTKAIAANQNQTIYHFGLGIALALDDKTNEALPEIRLAATGRTRAQGPVELVPTIMPRWDAQAWVAVLTNQSSASPQTPRTNNGPRRTAGYYPNSASPDDPLPPVGGDSGNSRVALPPQAQQRAKPDAYTQQLYAWFTSTGATHRDQAAALAKVSADHLLLDGSAAATLLDRVSDLCNRGNFSQAVTLLHPLGELLALDDVWLYLNARAHLGVGDYLSARASYTKLLTYRPDLAQGYLGRALAAAQLGETDRSNADLAIAAQVDPNAAAQFRSTYGKQLDTALASVPTEAPAALSDALFAAAMRGEDDAHLADRAVALRRASNIHRRFPDERYQDGLRRRLNAVAITPNDAAAWAELSTYIYYQASFKYGDNQRDDIEWEDDRVASLRYADQALRLDARNLYALATKAWLFEQDKQESDSLALAREGLQILPGYPRLAKLESILLNVSSLRATNEAARQRAPKHYSYMIPGWIVHVTRPPNEEELRLAREYDAMANANVGQASTVETAAWQKYRGAVQELNIQAGYLDWLGEKEKALEDWKQVVKLDPQNDEAWRNLAEIAEENGQQDDAFEYRFQLDNVFQTTAMPQVVKASKALHDNNLDAAGSALSRALAADPAEGNVYLQLGRLADARKQPDRYYAYLRCALALNEASSRLRGTTVEGTATEPLLNKNVAVSEAVLDHIPDVARKLGHAADADRYAAAAAALKRRIVQPLKLDLTDTRSALIPVLLAAGEPETAARLSIDTPADNGQGHPELMGASADAFYPLYVYLKPRLYHFQLWHYFGPGTLETYENNFRQRGPSIDPNRPLSKVNHPDAAE